MILLFFLEKNGSSNSASSGVEEQLGMDDTHVDCTSDGMGLAAKDLQFREKRNETLKSTEKKQYYQN